MYTLNPQLENEPVVWLIAFLFLVILVQACRIAHLRRTGEGWKIRYDSLPDAKESDEPSTDIALIRDAAEARGVVAGLEAKLEAANALADYYKSNPDLYWKGKYEALRTDTDSYRQAVQRDLFFLRSAVNPTSAEALYEWVNEDSDR